MADKKISELTAASTPLAGTEVLPIVQSSTTKKVATDDLTVKNIRSNATTGLLQVVGPAAAATRIMTVPNANFTVARTDDANSFTGDQTLSTGNLIMGTANKGIDFSANPSAAGMTSELFNDYEEGTFTPSLNFGGGTTGITYVRQSGRYTKIGNRVLCSFYISLSSKGSSTGAAGITGLPFTVAPSTGGQNQAGYFGYYILTGLTGAPLFRADSGSTTISLSQTSSTTAANLTDANFTDSSVLVLNMQYDV